MTTAAQLVATECTASGPGLTGKYTAQQVPTDFTIVGVARGGARVVGAKLAKEFTVRVRGAGKVEAALADGGDGTVRVNLKYPISGKYEVLVSLGKTPIRGSPFQVEVKAAGKPAVPAAPRFVMAPSWSC